MTIKSDKNILGGVPCLPGTRISISQAVAEATESGLKEFVTDFELRMRDVREAFRYCARRGCENNASRYCQGCSMETPFGNDLWKVARKLAYEQ